MIKSETPPLEDNIGTPIIPVQHETPISTLPAVDIEFCPPIEIPAPIGNIVDGKLLYVDYNSFEVFSFDFSTSRLHSLIRDGDKMMSYALSPNGDFLAYQAMDIGSNQEQLVITQTNSEFEQEQIQFEWSPDWDKVAYWLDQENLVIKLFPNEHYQVLLLNPFSGQTQKLIADFPNIYSLDGWPPDWNGSGQFIFNTELNRAIYADTNQKFILWDLTQNKELSRLQSMTFRQFPSKSPQWNQEGDQVVMAAPKISLDNMNDELFLIDQSGLIKQLTNFTSTFSAVSINRYSWSPDSRYIAMLISVLPGDYIEQLAIFDTFSQKEIVSCLHGDATITTNIDYRRSPRGFFDEAIYRGVVWLPDSQRLIVENRTANNAGKILLVDLSNETVYELFDDVNYLPIGWIKDR